MSTVVKVEKLERVPIAPTKPLAELNPGDSFYGYLLYGWQLVATLPSDVAETWVTQHFLETPISNRGITPSTNPVRDWERLVGIVAGTLPDLPGTEHVLVLQKHGPEDFRLFLSKDVRAVPRTTKGKKT